MQLSVFVSLGKCNCAKWDGPKMWGTAFMKTFCRSDFNMFENGTLMPQSTCALFILEHSGQLIFAVAASYCFALSLYCYLLLNGMTVMSICAQALWVIPQSKNSCNVTFISFHWYWTKEDKTQFVKQKLIYSQWKDDSAWEMWCCHAWGNSRITFPERSFFGVTCVWPAPTEFSLDIP